MRIPDSQPLDVGDVVPAMTLALAGGGELRVPDDLDQPYQAILVYRGHWCPYCMVQLKAFQGGLTKLDAAGIGVVAASVDDEEQTKRTIEQHGLTYPVAHGLSLMETARAFGGFYEPAPTHTAPYLNSTSIVMGPDRRVIVSNFSSGSIGRLAWQDVLGMVQYLASR